MLLSQLKGDKSPSTQVIMFILSEKFGWTPKQIREQRASDIDDYLKLIKLKNYIEEQEIEKNKRSYDRF